MMSCRLFWNSFVFVGCIVCLICESCVLSVIVMLSGNGDCVVR